MELTHLPRRPRHTIRRRAAALGSIALTAALLTPALADAARTHPDPLVPSGLTWVSNPTITGTPMVGWALTANSGAVSAPTATYSYQWQVCVTWRPCKNIAGAGLAYFVPSAAYVGDSVRVVITATFNEASTTRASARTAPIAPAAPALAS